jgi:Dolichyl-phosphate-mannose-protein mannosyltransferase
MSPDQNSERTIRWLLAAVLAVAFGIRLWAMLVLPRYFDDHYIFLNVNTFLNGSLRPRHSYYGSLSYLPQALVLAVCDLLHRWTGSDAFLVRGGPIEGFTLGAFRIMRLFIVGYAVASLWVVYLVGRRLFSPAVGLIAAAVLAAYPQHLRSTVQLKPDMMVLLFAVMTLYWTVKAAEDPRLSRFLLAGVGVGLATSAKYIGAAVALPMTVWAVWSGFRDRRRWAWLVLAGVASVVTFVALNPFLGTVFHYGRRVGNIYASHARYQGSDRLLVVRGELRFLAAQHGWILGAFLLLGIGLLVHRLWRRPGNGEAVLPLALGLGYPALYAAAMTLFRTHNLLPALGGTAILCAYGAAGSAEWLGRRHAVLRRPAAILLAASLLGGFLLLRPFTSAYRQLVPTTWADAGKVLRARLASSRALYLAHEPANANLRLANDRQGVSRTAAPSLTAVPSSLLDLTDAEIFPLSRTDGPQASFYRDRQRRVAEPSAVEVQPRLFRSQGSPLLILLHPWTPAGEPIRLLVRRSSGGLAARLPADLAAGEVLSIELIRPEEDTAAALSLQPADRNLALNYAGSRRVKKKFLTPRFVFAAGTAEIRVPAPAGARPRNYQMRLWRWQETGRP